MYLQRNLMGMFSRKVTLLLSINHVLKQPEVIKSDISWHTLVGTYLFCVLEIQIICCNGLWKIEGTVATVHTITRSG